MAGVSLVEASSCGATQKKRNSAQSNGLLQQYGEPLVSPGSALTGRQRALLRHAGNWVIMIYQTTLTFLKVDLRPTIPRKGWAVPLRYCSGMVHSSGQEA